MNNGAKVGGTGAGLRDPSNSNTSMAELARHREVIRGNVIRMNAAVAVILVAVLGLAVAALLALLRGGQQQARAELAEMEAKDRLWTSYLGQSRATRLTGRMGRRKAALQAIREATTLKPSVELRSEAMAALALTDLEPEPVIFAASVDSAHFSIDSQRDRFAQVDGPARIRIRSISAREQLFELDAREHLPALQQAVQSIRFSPDGDYLGVRYNGGAAIVWRLGGPEIVFSSGIEVTNRTLGGLVFDSAADLVLMANAERDGELCSVELKTGIETPLGIHVGARLFRVKPGSEKLAVATDNSVDLWDLQNRQKVETLSHPRRVFFIAWAPDGDHLVTTCQNGDVYYWDLEQQTFRLLSGHTEPCLNASFSPDGDLLVTGSRDGTSRVWDIREFRLLAEASEGMSLGFEGAAGRILFWRRDTGFGLWRVERSDCFRSYACDPDYGELLTFDLSTDGRYCVAVQAEGFQIWDLRSRGRGRFVPLKDLSSVRFSISEDTLLVCRSSGLEKWPFVVAKNGQIQFGKTERLPLGPDQQPRSITLSLDGQMAAVELDTLETAIIPLDGRGEPRILEQPGTVRLLKGPASPTGAGRFALSPDGRWLVFGSGFGNRPRVWDTATGHVATNLPCESGTVAFTPDGDQLYVGGMDNYIIWSVADWRETGRISRPGNTFTHGSLAFAVTEPLIALVSSRQQVRLWHKNSNTLLAELQPPNSESVNGLRLANDGSMLACATASDLVQVWDLSRMRQQLADLRLDWTQPVPASPAVPAYVGASISSTIGLASAVLVVSIAATVIVLRTHRLLREYAAAERLAEERRRELERASVELLHGQKMRALGTLAAGIAHDFNNLLSVIRMSNKLIGRETTGNAEIQDYVADVEQAVLQGKNVVGSMLGYARNQTGEVGPVHPRDVVESTVSLLSKEFLSGISLSMDLAPDVPAVRMSRGRLEQVLLNLIVNAAEAMQGKGQLLITAARQKQVPPRASVLSASPAAAYVEIAVKDSGPGISRELLGRIFEPFFTTKHSAARSGTGLGLSLVYTIAEQDGLGLAVESSPGKGASFYVLIPEAVEDSASGVRETHTSQAEVRT